MLRRVNKLSKYRFATDYDKNNKMLIFFINKSINSITKTFIIIK